MKKVTIGDFFMWMGQLVQAKWMNTGQPSIGFVTKEQVKCPYCDKEHEVAVPHDIIISSPLFQNNAHPVQTITNTHGVRSIESVQHPSI